MHPQRDTWIIVCEHFHGAVGPIPTEQLAVDLAVHVSEIGACSYRPVRLALAQDRAAGRADETAIHSTDPVSAIGLGPHDRSEADRIGADRLPHR
jgi:hypothetical protein